MTFETWTIEQIVADISAAAPTAATPEDLCQRLTEFSERHSRDLRTLRMHLMSNAMESVLHFESLGEQDREAIDRVIAQEFVFASAIIIMALYRRLGQPHSAARFAIVAHDLFRLAETLPAASNHDGEDEA